MIAVRDSIANLEGYSVEGSHRAQIIINANECNYSLPEPIERRVQAEMANVAINRYPGKEEILLRRVIGSDLGINDKQIFFGNGSSELLEKLCYAFGGAGKKIAYPVPSFSMYETYVTLADSTPSPYPLTQEGYIDAATVIEHCAKEQPSLLILCNPNNPTGNYTDSSVIEQILQNVPCPVVLDEAYIEFAMEDFGVEGQGITSFCAKSYLDKYSNYFCLRTFSKAFGLANLRIGYGVGSLPLVEEINKVLLPYHVNGLSLVIARIVYLKKAHLRKRLAEIIASREEYRKHWQTLPDVYIYPSSTNFLLLSKKTGTREEKIAWGEKIFKALLKQKVLVRIFARHPLIPGALRITVGSKEECDNIIRAVVAVLDRRRKGGRANA